MVEFSNWMIATQLLLALRWTVGLSLVAFALGGLLGMGLLVLRISRWPGAERAVAAYVQVLQGTPLLMQIFLVYFGLSMLGLDASPMLSACVCLSLYSAAYLCDIWRGAVNAVPDNCSAYRPSGATWGELRPTGSAPAMASVAHSLAKPVMYCRAACAAAVCGVLMVLSPGLKKARSGSCLHRSHVFGRLHYQLLHRGGIADAGHGQQRKARHE